MIPSYNCSDYLRKTLLSVLAQDPGMEKMQIEVIDDHSTDADVEALVAEIGKGRIGFFRQESNVGSLRNFETCLNRSSGEWVHILHGDDLVIPGFYGEIERLFRLFPDAGAAFTGYFHINDRDELLYPNEPLATGPGPIDNWFTIIAQSQQVQPPAMVVKRKVYEQLGGFYGMHYGEDWEMWVRISAHFPVVHSPMRLAKYRSHDHNITSNYFLSGQHIRDISKAIDLVQVHIPANKRRKLRRLARKNYAIYFARTTDMVYHRYKNPGQALAQARDSLSMHTNPTTLYFLVKILIKRLIRYKYGIIRDERGREERGQLSIADAQPVSIAGAQPVSIAGTQPVSVADAQPVKKEQSPVFLEKIYS
jgi:glycosyltransferase involved in cell wall biosynthesis